MISYLLFCLGFLGVGAVLVFTKAVRGLSTKAKAAVWMSKGIAALALIVIYTQVYPVRNEADIFKYFDDSKVLSQVSQENSRAFLRIMVGATQERDTVYLNRMNYWFRSYDHGITNDNRLIIRINAVMNLLTQSRYELNLSLFLGLSFIGGFWIYLFLGHFTRWKSVAFISAFLVPSTLFWSSGILKEAVLMAALGGFLISTLRLTKRFQWKELILGCFSLWILSNLKIYILYALIPAMLLVIGYSWFKSRIKTLVWTLVWVLGFYGIMALIFPSWSLISTLQGKQFDFIQMAKAVHAGSQIWIIPMDGTWFTMLKLVPLGIFNTMFYPHLFMVKNALTAMAFLENTALLLALGGCLYGILRKRGFSYWGWGFLLFSFTVFALVGMTAPVVGAMVRYKAPVLPFLVFAIIHAQPNSLLRYLEHHKFSQWLTTQL